MSILREPMNDDASIERAMVANKWSLDDLERELKLGHLGAARTPKAKYVAEYVERRHTREKSKTERDIYDLNVRLLAATESSAEAAKRSATAAVVSALLSLFALLVAFAAYVHEAGKP